jgi:hypothetical protein
MIKQRAELHYWLWKLGNQLTHGSDALRLYESLIGKTAKQEYRRRLKELSIIAMTDATDAPE